MSDLNSVWRDQIKAVLEHGNSVSPRGLETRELPQFTVVVDMRKPVLTLPSRKLSYQFMAAEAYWILSGSNKVDDISPWNKHISKFSDDGVKFFGAYGPKIRDQLDYVVDKLVKDPWSRQAGLTIWRENPPDTKDVPCTVAIFASIRMNKLNLSVFMRSSDIWLGLPYDVFNFSMLSHLLCARLRPVYPALSPGDLYLTAASSHLYSQHYEIAATCLTDETTGQADSLRFMFQSEPVLMETLKVLRDSKLGDPLRWWEYACEA